MAGASFLNIEEADKFLTSGERQSVILHFLNSVRAETGEVVGDINRLDWAGSSMECVKQDYLQLFCHCKPRTSLPDQDQDLFSASG